MSATVQSLGYGCAALGPSVLGAVHASSGGWTAPLLVVLGAVLAMGVSTGLGLRSMRRETP
jgi:CP family cyanate transporter-like MFS transporter